MAIVPRGKTRIMVAQSISSPLSEGYEDTSIQNDGMGSQSLETGEAMEEDIGDSVGINNGVNDDVSINDEEEQDIAPKENGRKTLTTYIYEKLQSYGYPGRRLQDFKAEFVKESISPEGVKDIQVIIPDKKYPDERGFTDTVENEELKEISHEINQMFGLNFNGAERSDGKWTIKFTSADLSDPEEDITHDSLDQVYGKPDRNRNENEKEERPMKAALTMTEMIKIQKDKIVNKLKKTIGDK